MKNSFKVVCLESVELDSIAGYSLRVALYSFAFAPVSGEAVPRKRSVV